MTTPLVNEQMVWDALRQVMDPEIGCNIVDLGLVYDVQIDGGKVRVQMTLTTPGCPMHESIGLGATQALEQIEGVTEAQVEIVWDPPWNPQMVSAEGKRLLGID